MLCQLACSYLCTAALLASYSLQVALAALWDLTCETSCYISLKKKSTPLAMSNFMFVPAIGSFISTTPTHAITMFSCMWCSFVTMRPRFCARTEQAFPCVPFTMYPCPGHVCLKLHGRASL